MKKCHCIRCQAAELVRGIRPNLTPSQALLAAQEIVKVIRAIPDTTRGKAAGKGTE